MLVLSRKTGQRIRITTPDGTHCWVSVERLNEGSKARLGARLGFVFPAGFVITREEVIDGGPDGADVMPSMPATRRGSP
jgi:hypothetical protein